MAFFSRHELTTVSDALDIAEDAIGNYYKFSLGQWKRHGYELKTLSSLRSEEISSFALAVLSKGAREVDGFESKTKERDFYFICLQDHLILNALRRDREVALMPLLVYVLTHELVHIVRFCGFFQRFQVSDRERAEEEKIVHSMAYDILKDISLTKLDYVLNSYSEHRRCRVALCSDVKEVNRNADLRI